MKKLELSILISGETGLSPLYGGFLWEAANVCLCENGHKGSVTLPGEGHFVDTYELSYGPLHERAADSFADLQEATEYGAMGIALAVMFNETRLKMKRSYKGTGVDYWLGVTNSGLAFEKKSKARDQRHSQRDWGTDGCPIERKIGPDRNFGYLRSLGLRSSS